MAYYAALVSVLQSLEEITGHGKYSATEEIKCIQEKMSLLQELLNDYSPKDKQVTNNLENRIGEVAYRAQDVIEAQILTMTHWPEELQKVKEEADSILDLAMEMKVKEEVESIVENELRIKRSLHSPPNNYSSDTSEQEMSGGCSMVGFDQRLKSIKEQLCGGPSELRVVSILGMGGIGKTTLARNIYEDKHIGYHFDCSAWITVSQDYHFRKVLLSIVDSMNIVQEGLTAGQLKMVQLGITAVDPLSIVKQDLKAAGEEVLIGVIYKHLKGRRYLIIMDDTWDVKAWDDMMKVLPEDSNGSRVLMTTRLQKVGIYSRTCGLLHQMEFLTKEQSWNLLCDKVFQQDSCPTELEDAARLIAENCRGLPLAIVVVAGLLSKINRMQHDWEEMARDVSSAAAENDEHFSKILSLSYNNLPHHLKPCFLYMGGFPEDYEIPISKLIKLWIAEGFVTPTEAKSSEEIGEDYLEDLVDRSLVLTSKKRSNGKLKSCSVHDLLRDLCIRRIQNDNFLHIFHENDHLQSEAIRNARRLCIYVKRGNRIPPAFSSSIEANQPHPCGLHVRSVVSFGWSCQEILLPLALSFKLLRVLETVKTKFISFPVEIGELFQLRYLAFHECILAQPMLPISISKLKNLQTLIIGSEIGFGNLHRCLSIPSIWQMPQLKHIIINQIRLSPILLDPKIAPEESPVLQNLQTLSRAVNLKFTNEIMGMIPNLHKLKLMYSGQPYYVQGNKWRAFCIGNLIRLRRLQTLDIVFKQTMITKKERALVPFPVGFTFPISLTKLTLKGCWLPWTDLTTVGALPNLQVLKLKRLAVSGNVWEPAAGLFLSLKFLLLHQLDLTYWRCESFHYPSLEHLEIVECKSLTEIPPEIGEIETLQMITVHRCQAAASALRIEEEQIGLGNDALQVRVFLQNDGSEEYNPDSDKDDVFTVAGSGDGVSDIDEQEFTLGGAEGSEEISDIGESETNPEETEEELLENWIETFSLGLRAAAEK